MLVLWLTVPTNAKNISYFHISAFLQIVQTKRVLIINVVQYEFTFHNIDTDAGAGWRCGRLLLRILDHSQIQCSSVWALSFLRHLWSKSTPSVQHSAVMNEPLICRCVTQQCVAADMHSNIRSGWRHVTVCGHLLSTGVCWSATRPANKNHHND